MPEGAGYRFIVVISQHAFWLVGQVLRLRYDIHVHHPAGLGRVRLTLVSRRANVVT